MNTIKKTVIFLLCISALYSCNSEFSACERRRKTIYTYGNLTVTRIDRCDVTYFYYSNPNVEHDVGYIYVRYRGFTNSWFRGLIEFDTINSKVIIYEVSCCFYGKDLDTAFFAIGEIYRDPPGAHIEQVRNLKNSPNVYEVSLGNDEKWNRERGVSEVKVERFPTEYAIWWQPIRWMFRQLVRE